MQQSRAPQSDFISETEFYDKYFGYIIQKRQLETKTANGNQKFMVSVGREGELLAKHIAIKVYSQKTGKYYMSYAAKPVGKYQRQGQEDQIQVGENFDELPEQQTFKNAKDKKFHDEIEAKAVAAMLGSEQ